MGQRAWEQGRDKMEGREGKEERKGRRNILNPAEGGEGRVQRDAFWSKGREVSQGKKNSPIAALRCLRAGRESKAREMDARAPREY